MNICTECTTPFKPKHGSTGKFCCLSCSTTYNNRLYPKKIKKSKFCSCGNEIFTSAKKCKCCISIFRSNSLKERHLKDNSFAIKGGLIGGKASANKRKLRSKDEIKLFELCSTHFSNVTHNEIISDGWDADILLNNQKIAILWNGPWHYKEMGIKGHSLLQVQTRDKIKKDVLTNAGWTVIIFNDNEYTPKSAFDFLVAEPWHCPRLSGV